MSFSFFFNFLCFISFFHYNGHPILDRRFSVRPTFLTLTVGGDSVVLLVVFPGELQRWCREVSQFKAPNIKLLGPNLEDLPPYYSAVSPPQCPASQYCSPPLFAQFWHCSVSAMCRLGQYWPDIIHSHLILKVWNLEPSYTIVVMAKIQRIGHDHQALWADAFYKLRCPCVCLSVCVFVRHTFSLRLTVFLPPHPEVQCPSFLNI